MTTRENVLKAIRFEQPEHIPMHFHINPSCWHHYDPEALQDLMEAHPLLFPGYRRQKTVVATYVETQRKDAPYTDPWGCIWETTDDGITGSVHQHPLDDWDRFNGYKAPDPETTDGTYPVDWARMRSDIAGRKQRGELIHGTLPHGHTFLRLQDIRGYENLLFDMMDEHPDLPALIEMVADFNYEYVMKWMALEPDIMSYPEDLGMQSGPMLSPELFYKYIQPVFRRVMKPARDSGCIVHMHSDGDIRGLVDGLIDGGVDVINLQDLVNGIDWIRDRFAGHTCIDLDIDRQNITARGTPAQIDALIREEVEKLGSKKGGLMMIYGLYGGLPLRNIAAVMDAMEKYAVHYS